MRSVGAPAEKAAKERYQQLPVADGGADSHRRIGLTCVATIAMSGITSFQPTLMRTYLLAPRQ